MPKKRVWLWSALLVLTLGEAIFWWVGVQLNYWGLPSRSRYTALQGEPVAGLKRIVVNFRHFFLFWTKPPDTQTYHNLYELWLSDGSSPYRNLLHPLFFGGVPFLLIGLWRYSPKETLLWLLVFNVLREYVGEGWRLEPSFSDLWVDVIFSVLGVWTASRVFKRGTASPAERG
jgi:hypothetical protein